MKSRTPTLSVVAVITASLAVLCACAPDGRSASAPTVRLAMTASSHAAGRPFMVDMTQEVTTQPVYAGDPDGVGSALITINLGRAELCWDVTVRSILLPATASHIHRAVAGVRGSIVVPLSPPDATGAAQGCATGISADLLREILTSPDSFYVNVHTSEFPASAIRGQLR